MRLFVKFSIPGALTLPINYQQMLQGFIYRSIGDEQFSAFMHEEGFLYEKRHFKLFTFSRLIGKCKVEPIQKTITFYDHIRWQVSSCIPKFIQELGQGWLMKSDLHWNGHPIEIEELQYQLARISEASCKIRMLSPITVHSTYPSHDGKKTTQYFTPKDPAFAHLISENIIKKYKSFYGQSPDSRLEIKTVQVGHKDKVVTRFKGFVIEGWNGLYELHGSPDILNFAYSVGLGDRNSQGFGMFEHISK